MTEEFTHRLNQFIQVRGISVRDFEMKVGLSNGLIGRAIREARPIGSDKLQMILKTYTVLNPTWLLLGEEEMERGARVGEGVRVQQTAIGNGNRQEVRVHDLEARIASLESLVATKDQVIALLEERIEELKKGG